MDEDHLDLDVSSRAMLRELMCKKEFQELWMKLTAKTKDFNVHKRNTIGYIYDVAQAPLNDLPVRDRYVANRHKSILSVREGFRQIIQRLEVAVDTFARGTQMARYESELPSGTNRDAVAIYSTHIRLEHFCSSSKFMADQVGLICRQLSALIGSFTKSISCVYSLARSSNLASTLAHLLVKFYECTLSRLDNFGISDIDPIPLKRAIERFKGIVCASLERMAKKRESSRERRRGSLPPVLTCSGRSLNRSNTLPRMEPVLVDGRVTPVPFVRSDVGRRQRSFLLSPELEYQRKRMCPTGGQHRSADGRNPKDEKLGTAWELPKQAGPADIKTLKKTCRMALELIEDYHIKRKIEQTN